MNELKKLQAMNEIVQKLADGFSSQMADAIDTEKCRIQKAYDAGYRDGINDLNSQPAGSPGVTEAYLKGLNEAWECARLIVCSQSDVPNALSYDDVRAVFGSEGGSYILSRLLPEDAIRKIKEWKDSKGPVWEKDEHGTIRCSKCGNMSPFNKRYCFCPSCGTDMGLKR